MLGGRVRAKAARAKAARAKAAACWLIAVVASACSEEPPQIGLLYQADGNVLADATLDGVELPDTVTPEVVVPDGCSADAQCAAYGRVCDTASHACVECLTDQHCPQPKFCLDQRCWDDVCKPGETRCYGSKQVAMCAANGGAWLPQDCPPNTLCTDGTCVAPPCKPGTTRCAGTVVMRCRPDGSGEDVDEDCKATDRVCIDGVCKPKVCSKGEVSCADQDTALFCEDPNKGWSAKDCVDQDPCTFDLCHKGKGCAHPPKPDGMACGVDQWCLSGKCTAVTNNLVVMFDTSGSMNAKVPKKICYEQAWPACNPPGKACDRMGVSKNIFGKAFATLDPKRTRTAMFRFPQLWLPPEATTTPKPPFWKPPVACANGYYVGYATMTGHTVEDGVGPDTAWYWDHLDEVLCAPFPQHSDEDSSEAIAAWMDGKETWGSDPELRSIGGTPIGRTLFYIGEYLRHRVVVDGKACASDADCANPNYHCAAGVCRDPARACRRTTVVVFTDGGEENYPDKFFSPWVQAKRLAYGLRCKTDADCAGGARCVCPPSQPGCAAAARECLPDSLDTGYYCRDTMASCIPTANQGAPGYCPKKNGQNQCVEDPIVGVAAQADVFAHNVLRSPDGQPFGVTVHVVDISAEPNGIERSGNLARAGGGMLLAPEDGDEDAFLASLVKAFDVKPKPACGVGVLPCGQAGFGPDCDDGDACTNDACIQSTGTCSHTPNVSACDDGNACTLSDRCLDGECRPGIAWVETRAGNGLSKPGLGKAMLVGLPAPQGLVELADGSVVISDGHRLVRLQGDSLQAFAGSDGPGAVDGPVAAARFLLPEGLARAGEVVWVADAGNRRVRRVADGMVTTAAGQAASGFLDGVSSNARFASPIDVAVDHDGSVLIVDRDNQRLRRLAGDAVNTVVGDGTVASSDGPLATARLAHPIAVDVGPPGVIFVGERYRIRRLAQGVVVTVAGAAPGFAEGVGAKARFDDIRGIVVRGDGGLLVADGGNNRIRAVSPAFAVTTLSGTQLPGWIDGFAGGARYWGLHDITLGGGGRLWIADGDNHRLRLLQLAEVSCPDGGPCNTGLCDAATGTCTSKPRPDGAACDISPCLEGETCSALLCQGGVAKDCDDGESCTVDSCDGATGVCVYTASGGACDDGSACTAADACQGGVCVGVAKNCDDGLTLTEDLCEAGQCLHRVTGCSSDQDCYDGEQACTVDRCLQGQCQFEPTGKPGCCTPTLWRVDFANGSVGDVQVVSTLGSGQGWRPWTAAGAPGLSGQQTLYYGDPALGSFDLAPVGHGGRLLRGKLALPPGRKSMVRLQLWLDTERAALYDALTLAVTASGKQSVVWSKGPKTPMQAWTTVEADLSAWAGRSIELQLRFDTVDGIENGGRGVVVDAIEVVAGCD